MNNYSPITTFNGAVRAASAPSHNDDLVRKQDASGLSYISSISGGSSAYLSVDASGALSVDNLLISDVHVDGSQTSLANFISNEGSAAAALKKGDFLVLTAATGGAESYIVSGANGSVAGNYTQVESGLTSAEIVAKLTGGTGISIAANGTIAFNGNTDVVAEGSSNLYYTDARWDTRLAAKSTTNLTEGSNLYYTDARFDTRLAAKTTANLTEGSNLYYTDARSRAAVGVEASNAGLAYNSSTGKFRVSLDAAGGLGFNGASVKISDNGIKDSMIDWGTGANQVSTADIPEQTNLYYTDARSRAALSAGAGIAYNNGTGAISCTITQYTDAAARSSVSGGDGLAYNSGSGVFSLDLTANKGLEIAGGKLQIKSGPGIIFDGGDGSVTIENEYFRKVLSSQSLLANTPKTINHGLGQKYVQVSVYDSSDNLIHADVSLTDANNCTVTSISALSGVTVVCSL
tara:strand:+ start:3530 stop:4912 length:1383 start_codon:yes stop_codon:yes gene_type:complete